MGSRVVIKGMSLATAFAFTFAATLNAGAEEIYLGGRIATKDELVRLLKPKPLTRGISLDQNAGKQTANDTSSLADAGTPAAVSMAVHFAIDSYQISDQAARQLHPLGEALMSDQLTSYQFLVEGHTDARGTEDYNLALSQKRAEAVKQHLVRNYAIHPGRLITSGKGEYMLLDPADPLSGVNRRVAIVNIAVP